MSRAIVSLQAAMACPRPASIPVGRPRGRKAAGVRYEREFAQVLPEARHGQWFQFLDRNGKGHCQTDFLLDLPEAVVILEAKYTWTLQGHWQIASLYKPVVERVYGKVARGIMVCKSLTAESPMEDVCRDLPSALARCLTGRPTVLHWVGQQLRPRPRGPLPCPVDSPFALL